MELLSDWLEQLRGHYQDYAWLTEHTDVLYQTIESALNYPPQVNSAVEGLIAICPYMFTRSDYRRWSGLLFDALLNAQLIQDNEYQMRLWAQMGEGFYIAGRHEQARQAFNTALERARQGRTKEMMLSAYIGIIRLQSLKLDASFDARFVREALELARDVGDGELQASLHQALALAFTHRGETQAALGYGQMAYAYWHRTAQPLEMGRTAFILSHACRVAKQLPQAERYLRLAQDQFTKTGYTRQFYLISYEEGVLRLENQDYETAQQLLEMAVQEAQQLEQPVYVAMSLHSLAIVQIELALFEEAERNLHAALAMWEQMDNRFYQANCCHALGYLDSKRGDMKQALAWLRRAEALCDDIAEVPLREMVRQLVADTVLELNGKPAHRE